MPIENVLGFLRTLSGNRPLPDTVIIFGPHGFLREFVVNALATRSISEGYTYRSFHIGAGDDFAAVLDEFRAPDLFAAKLVVVCRVLKSHRDRGGDETAEGDDSAPSKAGPTGADTALAEVIEKGTAPNRLLTVYERDNVPARVRKVAERSAALVNCMRPFDNQIADYTRAFARIRGIKLKEGTTDFLAAGYAGDLAAIASAVEKAALSVETDKPLGPEDFGEPGSRRMPELFEIADSIARGCIVNALGQMERALAFGRDSIEILAVEVIPLMRRMMIAASMLRRGRSAGEIAAALGASPTSGLVGRAIDGARRFGLERLRKSYADAIELDASFKNGTIKEREQALGALLLELRS
jgi:DNA polymerase III delta subunit